MEEQSEKYLFEEMPVPKAVATLAIPTIISQVVTMIYNLADTFFIGQIGDPYMVAAVSLVSPWFNLLTALGNLFGLGGSSLISRLLCRRLCRFRAADPASVHPGGADQYAGRAVPSDRLPCRAADLREFPHQLYAAGHGLAARQPFPMSSAATDGSAMRSEIMPTDSARVWVSCSTYSSACWASPSCKRPRMTCSLLVNSCV